MSNVKETVNGFKRITRRGARNFNEAQGTSNGNGAEDTVVERKILRSKYLKFKNRICDERDDLSKVDSDKFIAFIEEVDGLHEQVKKPREQVADAEALFGITNTFVDSVKAYNNDGVTTSDFVSCLLRDFGQFDASTSQNELRSLIHWGDIGQVVSHDFRSAPGFRTMVGPMNTELKQRRTATPRKREKLTVNVRPEELDETNIKEITDTDKNMAIMFDVLRKNRKAKLENLILNRKSFAQTVENLFALSFLVKDGRAEILVNEAGCHLVSPKNAPSADAIKSGEATYDHFIFRYDFKDWKSMLDSVVEGNELMPHRIEVKEANTIQASQPTPPIRKLCRNRGLVMQEQNVDEDSPESEDAYAYRRASIRRGKRKKLT